MTSADMTMAGIFSKIPPDEVIDAMRSIGRSMNEDIRETGKGGLAGDDPDGVDDPRPDGWNPVDNRLVPEDG